MATFPNPFTRHWMDTTIEKRPSRAATRQQYIGLELFPLKRVDSYELTWDMIHNANHLAGVYAHDGVPIPGNDPDYESLVTDIMHIMASRIVHPNVVLKLRQAGELSVNNTMVQSMRRRLLAHVAQKLASCQDEVESVIEYLCMQVLQGTLNWPPQTWAGAAITPAPAYWGDVAFTMTTGYAAAMTQNASALLGWNARAGGGLAWTNVNSNPILDLEVISELIEETYGVRTWGSTLLMNRTTLSTIAFNANILRWIRGDTGSPPDSMTPFINVAALKDYLATKLGYTIKLYDAQWTYETGLSSPAGVTEVRLKFLRPGRVVLIPPDTFGGGNSYFASAPDMGAPNGERLGLYTWTRMDDRPPWSREVGAGIHGFPIMRQLDGVFLLQSDA